ncbi:hypothetical protein BDF22DRAFT_677352 [Syncephalis plumigaleata]|nr:hypothetical protein BDF22DRAFT_677352 [Syncephalis plumigaleata]
MLQAAAAAMTAAKDATSLSLPSNSALTTTTTPVTATTSTTDVSVAALQLLASQSQASSQTANALLAGTYGTPDVTSTILPNDQFMQNVSSPATALAMQELLASQLFPPLAPASTSSASPQTPSLSQPSQFTSPYTTFNSPPDAFGADALAFNTDTLAFLSQNLNNPIFTDYRDTSSLNALLSEPVEVPVPGANGQPLVFDDTVNSLPSATIVPLENLTGMESMVNPMKAKQQPLAASVANHQKLEEYCASGVLSEDDLDFLCAEMKTKCRAAKEAAEAKFEQLRKEYADQEKRVAHAKLMSSQLDALGTDNTSINGSNTTPPLP